MNLLFVWYSKKTVWFSKWAHCKCYPLTIVILAENSSCLTAKVFSLASRAESIECKMKWIHFHFWHIWLLLFKNKLFWTMWMFQYKYICSVKVRSIRCGNGSISFLHSIDSSREACVLSSVRSVRYGKIASHSRVAESKVFNANFFVLSEVWYGWILIRTAKYS